jgi:hypothetical protein
MAGMRDQVEEMDFVDEAIPHEVSDYMVAITIIRGLPLLSDSGGRFCATMPNQHHLKATHSQM